MSEDIQFEIVLSVINNVFAVHINNIEDIALSSIRMDCLYSCSVTVAVPSKLWVLRSQVLGSLGSWSIFPDPVFIVSLNEGYIGKGLTPSYSSSNILFLKFLTAVNCGTLNNPANGRVSHTGGTAFGQTATYICNTGYNRVGSHTRTCQATGMWSGSAPTCQGMLYHLFINCNIYTL